MLPLPESRHCRRTRCADMLLVVFIGDTPRLQDVAALKIIMRGLEYFRGPEDPCFTRQRSLVRIQHRPLLKLYNPYS